MIEIPLTQGKVAIVDDCDAHLLAWKWYAHYQRGIKGFYAVRRATIIPGKQVEVPLHHALLGYPLKGLMIDHRNGNSLDNCRSNLRIVTRRENASNTRRHRDGTNSSRFPGVTWNKHLKKWHAQIQVNGRQIYLGLYVDEQEAAGAYQSACGGSVR